MDQDRKYPVLENLAYCVRATKQGYPKLLLFCLLIIPINCLVPLLAAFLPKIVIDEITAGSLLPQLLAATAVPAAALDFNSRSKLVVQTSNSPARIIMDEPVRTDRGGC